MTQPPPDERSGIFATRIDATNVVSGTQLQGDLSAADAVELIALAKDLRGGRIEAAQITATNVVSGLQFIRDPATATPSDLALELGALRERLDAATAAGEFENQSDVVDATEALDAAHSELQVEQPNGNRVVRKLGELCDIVTAVAEKAVQMGKSLTGLSTLAPIAAAVWQVAQHVFAIL